MYDLVLRGGRIMDGTGSPWYRADVAVAGDRIAAIGRSLSGSGTVEIEVSDLVVAPGFIDIHSHSDVTLLVNPRAESAIRQGITTQVVGHCGFSAAPVRPREREVYRRDSFIYNFEGYNWTWDDIAGYRQALANAQPAINVVTLVGHGTLRRYAMGLENRPPTEAELTAMKDALRQAMEQGAHGLSSGLTYAPGRFSRVEEMIALCEVVREHGGVYHTHMRDYTRFLLESIEETIRVGRETDVPVNISHMYPAAPAYWGEMAERALERVESARAQGVEITFDITPWRRGGGPFMQALPDWAQSGGYAALKKRLEDPETRKKIVHELEHGAPDWKGWMPMVWDDQLIARTGKPENSVWAGRSIADIASERGLPPAQAALLLLLEDDGQYWTAPTTKSQDDINRILTHPVGVPITDGMALAPYGPLGHPTMPRSYGTFPRVLGRYAREWKLMSMETAVQKLTAEPATRVGVMRRGILRTGLYADITVFNPDTVLDKETYGDSHAFPVGIEFVIVNGEVMVEPGTQNDVRTGRVL